MRAVVRSVLLGRHSLTHRARHRAPVRPLGHVTEPLGRLASRPALWGATALVVALPSSGAGLASSHHTAGSAAAPSGALAVAAAVDGAPSGATAQLLRDRGTGGTSRSDARQPLTGPAAGSTTGAGGDPQDAASAARVQATQAQVQAQAAAEAQRQADAAAEAQRQADAAAEAQRQADAAAEAQRQAQQQAQAVHDAEVATAVTDPRAAARGMVADRGWGAEQFSCLDRLWTKESGWLYTASNRSSHAYGIPQSLPGTKMASAGADWQTNPRTQITWGLGYIASSYGTPCAAWAHSRSSNWY